jgi:hypothetical protein
MKPSNQQEFEAALNALERGFTSAQNDAEGSEELGLALVEFVLQRERLRRGVEPESLEASAVDAETLEKMRTWDSNDPAMSTVEKVFRRFATDRLADAAVLLQAAVLSKIQSVSEAQRRRASTPRKPHPFDVLIEQIVRKKPGISEKELLRALDGHVGKGVIDEINDTEICFRDGRAVAVSGLKDRLSAIKKKISR